MLRLLRTLIFSLLCTGLLFACSHTPKNSGTSAKELAKPTSHSSKKLNKGYKISQFAKSLIGSPYRYGGNSPKQGFDCSGLVYYTHGKFGVRVPRTSKQQFSAAKPITRKELQSGDLVFFKLNKREISHVGIYIGSGQFIHAPKSGKAVTTSSLNETYWHTRIAGSGRLY